MSKKYTVLVLAGGNVSPEMAQVVGDVPSRSLIRLRGRPMIDYVLWAFRDGLRLLGKEPYFVIVSNHVAAPLDGVVVASGNSLVDSLFAGLAEVPSDAARVLVATADIPFLTRDGIADLIERFAQNPQADFLFPIVDAESCHAAFPGMKRTTLKLAEGEFTGGNIVALAPALLRGQEQTLRAAYEQRKNVAELAKILGPEAVFRLAASRVVSAALPLVFLERAVSRLLGGITACAVVSPYPEIAADVDHPEDIPIAERILAIQAKWDTIT